VWNGATRSQVLTISVYDDVIVSQDFENGLVGFTPPLPWKISTGDTSNYVAIAATDKGKSLKLTVNTVGSNPSASYPLGFIKGKIFIDGDFMVGAMNGYRRVEVYDSNNTVCAHIGSFNPDGTITCYTGAGEVKVGTYQANTWYHLHYELDTDAGTYTLYINDALVANKLPFRTGLKSGYIFDWSKGIQQFRIDTSVAVAGLGEFYMDNLVIKVPQTAAQPIALPKGGSFSWAQDVALTTTTAGAKIYYTTDGSNPTAASLLYTTPINVSKSLTLKAIAIKDGMISSAIMTEAYVINSGPIVSQDFENGVVGSAPPAPWKVSAGDAANNAAIATTDKGKSLKLTVDTVGKNPAATYPLGFVKGKITIDGDFMVGAMNGYKRVEVYDSNNTVCAHIGSFNPDGTITCYTGAGEVKVGTYQPNTWYHLYYELDTDAGTYTLYINDALVANKLPFRTGLKTGYIFDWSKGIQQFRIDTSVAVAGLGEFYMDNLVIADPKDFVDSIPPVTTISVDGTVVNGWYFSDVAVTLSATDNRSGVDRTEYRLGDSGDWSVYTGPVTLTQEGIMNFQYRSVDKAGNVEATKQQTVQIDKTSPVTTASIDGTLKNGWYSSDVTVTMSAYDNLSGVARTEYRIGNSGDWNIYTGPVLMTQEGTYTVQYRSTDKAGNVEDVRQQTVQIDKTPPDFSLIVNGNVLNDGGSFDDYLPLTFKVSDNLSGMAYAQISVGGSVYAIDLKTQPSIDIDLAGKAGSYTATIIAEDIAGNRIEKNFTFTVTTSIDSMRHLIDGYIKAGAISGPLLSQLDNNLKQAQHQLDIGRPEQAAMHMEDFIKHVNNSALEKYVADTAKEVLRNDANALTKMWS
jgi:hypothetical protein